MNQIGKKEVKLIRRSNSPFFEEDNDTSNDDNDEKEKILEEDAGDVGSEESSEDSSEESSERSSKYGDSEQKVINTIGPKKRRNKHAPTEVTSKKPVSRFRQIVEIPRAVKRKRDPRFDSISGKFNEDLFEKSYSFLNEYKESEIEQIKNQIKKEKDPNEKSKLQQLLNKLQSRLAHEQNIKRKKESKRERKKKELELVSQGKNPFYYKRSDEKKLELIDKFNRLQKSDPKVLEKVIAKRRKKNYSKEHKYVPFKRRKVD